MIQLPVLVIAVLLGEVRYLNLMNVASLGPLRLSRAVLGFVVVGLRIHCR